MNPFCDGTRIKLGLDVLAKGYNRGELSQAFYGLIAETRQGKLLLECASFDEIDQEYNPGDDDQNYDRIGTEELILEAVTVRAFSRTAQTMSALQRVLNKAMADKGLTVGDAVIGNPKKTGLFASVTVQFPISDGQTLSIIFHSPDNNKLKIMPDDVIIAFRWLLNKRDITVAVSPEVEKDISLDEVGKRVSQLVEKNSQRFQTQQKVLVEGKKALEELKTVVSGKQGENDALMNTLADQQSADKVLADKIEGSKRLLEQTVNYNDQLQAQIDSLSAQKAANAGKSEGEGTKTPEQLQTEQDQEAFEAKKAAFEQELTGRGFEVKGEAFSLDIGSANLFSALAKEDDAYQVGTRFYANLSSENPTNQKIFKSATLAGLDKQIADALAWIDKKLAGIKNAGVETVEVVNPDTAGGGTHGIEMDPKANPDPEVVDPGLANPDTNPDRAVENAAVTTLNDIIAGKYATSAEIDAKLDEAASALEVAGLLELYDDRLNSAADYLTEILKKEAAGVK